MPLHSAVNTPSGPGRMYGGTFRPITASFHTSSKASAPAMAMPTLAKRARRRRECVLAAETATRSSAEGSCGISLMSSLFEQRADFARQPDVFGMAEGFGGDARPRQID